MQSASEHHQQVSTLQRSERPCRLLEWKPWQFDNPTLLGHCAVAFVGGWCISGIPIFRSAAGLGVGVPSIPQLDAEGRVKIRDGKKQYAPVLTFETAEARERWQRAVLSALHGAGIGGEPS